MRRPLLAALAALAAGAGAQDIGAAPAPPEPPREFRGVWVATVDNIDWPSRPGLPTAQQRQELDAILDLASAMHLNAVVFQVRPMADALYPSELEPWSEWLTGLEGKAPDPPWDPLAHAVAGAHRRGLELHAWFNPYRVRHPKAKSRPALDKISRQKPYLVVRYGDYQWLDPGWPQARQWSLAVIRDVVQRYDVDGVHLDDYFYPYPIGGKDFPDRRSYAEYRRRGGKLARPDWRRQNVDLFIEELYRLVKADKPWVKVGISPFGIARPGLPEGIEAGIDQYDQLYADVQKWLRLGWCDYMAPQLYWPIDQKPQSFARLLPWWAEEADNPLGRAIWPGINPGRQAAMSRNWRRGELLEQIERIRAQPGATGHIHFSMRVFLQNAGGLTDALVEGPYAGAALVPAMPWLVPPGEPLPAAPEASLEERAQGRAPRVTVRWKTGARARFVLIQELRHGRWRAAAVAGAGAGEATLPGQDLTAVALSATDRAGRSSPPIVLRR